MASEDGEMWREWKKMKQDARTQRRENAPDDLHAAGIPFTVHNEGAHLIVEGPDGFIDFWPGTSRWKDRSRGTTGFGISGLIKHVQR